MGNHKKNKNNYKFEKNLKVANKLVFDKDDGLTDKELNGNTYLLEQQGFTNENAAILDIIAELGAVLGGGT